MYCTKSCSKYLNSPRSVSRCYADVSSLKFLSLQAVYLDLTRLCDGSYYACVRRFHDMQSVHRIHLYRSNVMTRRSCARRPQYMISMRTAAARIDAHSVSKQDTAPILHLPQITWACHSDDSAVASVVSTSVHRNRHQLLPGITESAIGIKAGACQLCFAKIPHCSARTTYVGAPPYYSPRRTLINDDGIVLAIDAIVLASGISSRGGWAMSRRGFRPHRRVGGDERSECHLVPSCEKPLNVMSICSSPLWIVLLDDHQTWHRSTVLVLDRRGCRL